MKIDPKIQLSPIALLVKTHDQMGINYNAIVDYHSRYPSEMKFCVVLNSPQITTTKQNEIGQCNHLFFP